MRNKRWVWDTNSMVSSCSKLGSIDEIRMRSTPSTLSRALTALGKCVRAFCSQIHLYHVLLTPVSTISRIP